MLQEVEKKKTYLLVSSKGNTTNYSGSPKNKNYHVNDNDRLYYIAISSTFIFAFLFWVPSECSFGCGDCMPQYAWANLYVECRRLSSGVCVHCEHPL